jgi:phage baseplate assembly protein W
MEYYTLPLDLGKVMRQEEHPKCSLMESVKHHLHLLVTTAFGEFPEDPGFGCGIWEFDFDNLTSAHKLREYIRESLHASVLKHEQRVGNLRVTIGLRQEEVAEQESSRVKKRIDVTIAGVLVSTNEPFVYRDSFFVGPLSYQ